ncbi:MAG TPA: serpin family protein [Spirochaetota bacterium]|nr:serpin family protein [Spirochaetota bacterium]
MKTEIRLTAALMVLLLTSFTLSCDSSSENNETSLSYLTSELDRNLNPDASPDEKSALIAGNTDFAFEMFAQLTDSDENIIYSPYSLSLAMAMVWGGAAGNTAAGIADAFHYTLANDRFHPAFNAVDLALRGREYIDPENGKKLDLVIANAFWGQIDYHFLETYLDLLALNYGAGIYELDFMTRPNACTDTINDWINIKTRGLIRNAIQRGTINSNTRAVLTNAIYFYANWIYEFSKSATSFDYFTLADESTITTETMHIEESFRYNETDDCLSVELPYAGNKMSMLVVMPKADYMTFESGLSRVSLDAVAFELKPARINLSLPKFKIEYAIDEVNSKLESLGMIDAFDPSAADFSGITGGRDLYISDVLHKAVIAVDETGTEAAATTVVVFAETAVEPAVPVTVDKPFLFFIRDMETGAILFMGRVLDPRGDY